jgi:hypothetical protein
MHRRVATYARDGSPLSSTSTAPRRKASKETITMRNLAMLAGSLTLCTSIGVAVADGDLVPYPTGYRDWIHVKSMVIEPGHPLHESFGGLHHLYANDRALEGYRSGRFPDGAVIVFDLLTAVSAGSAVTEGPRKVLGVMHKDSKRYPKTGGWGFEGFVGDSHSERAVAGNATTACFACHEARRPNDYVFSEMRR